MWFKGLHQCNGNFVNPADCNNRAFTRACQVDFVEMLILVRSDPRVKVEECGSEALECAAMNDCTTVLLYLLRECQIDPKGLLSVQVGTSAIFTELILLLLI
jgi:hypothetical protein